MIELKEPLNYTVRVKPITLPVPGFETVGPAIASGWGQIGGNMFPKMPNVLQFAELPILSGEGKSFIILNHIKCLSGKVSSL